MRAAQLVAYEKDLQVQQADAPVITNPHDAIVRVGGAGFCRADIHM
jgi:NAD+-dependent secondary alcohol dehydrogenase Adh1